MDFLAVEKTVSRIRALSDFAIALKDNMDAVLQMTATGNVTTLDLDEKRIAHADKGNALRANLCEVLMNEIANLKEDLLIILTPDMQKLLSERGVNIDQLNLE